MDLEYFRHLFSYTEWANARIIDAIRGLTDEQRTRRLESSFPNIHATLAHVGMAEWIWLRRWKGESPTQRPWWDEAPGLETVVEQIHGIESERRQYLSTLKDEDVAKGITYTMMSGQEYTTRLADLFAHVVNHSTYHRGQLTTMLRQVGATPPATDLIVFVR